MGWVGVKKIFAFHSKLTGACEQRLSVGGNPYARKIQKTETLIYTYRVCENGEWVKRWWTQSLISGVISTLIRVCHLLSSLRYHKRCFQSALLLNLFSYQLYPDTFLTSIRNQSLITAQIREILRSLEIINTGCINILLTTYQVCAKLPKEQMNASKDLAVPFVTSLPYCNKLCFNQDVAFLLRPQVVLVQCFIFFFKSVFL